MAEDPILELTKQGHFRAIENTFRKQVAPQLIQSCDATLSQYRDHAIGVIGTGSRGAYSVMRRLAVNLPERGPHRRIKLLDISTKLLLGPVQFAAYQAANRPQLVFHSADKERDEKLFSYIKESGLLSHDKIVLLDTGFNGTVIRNLKRIIQEKMPKKEVKLMLYASHDPSIPMPPGITERDVQLAGQRIATWLEFPKPTMVPSNFQWRPSNVQTGFDFEKWRGGHRPKYGPTDEHSRRLNRKKHRVLREETDEYIEQIKTYGEYHSVYEG